MPSLHPRPYVTDVRSAELHPGCPTLSHVILTNSRPRNRGNSPMRLLVPVLLALLGVVAAQAQSVESFYRGRTINLVIGYSDGGGYDIHGRVLARHLGNHIPGN